MYEAVLIAHIAGAVVTLGVVLAALVLTLRAGTVSLPSVGYILNGLAAFEVFTGVLLAVLSAVVTVASVCDNIALYLLLVAAVDGVLYARTRSLGIRFPVASSIRALGGSLVLLALGFALGF